MSTESVRRSADEISDFLVRNLAELLDTGTTEIALTEPFANFGLTSAVAVVLVGRMSTWLGRSLPPDLPWQYPTVRAMADGLAGETAATAPATDPVQEPARPQRAQEPIAIIGIGCVAADRRGPEQLWETLWRGEELVGKTPDHRCDQAGPRFGSFVPDPYAFDAGYFGIAADEAAYMDPQHRLLAETVADAFADAGVPTAGLAGTAAGVFVGISSGENARDLDPAGRGGLPIAAVTGNAASLAANRLSYLFDLRGPSLSVDTACSSSLVAVHLALRSLHDGDCELAVAGGVNLTLEPGITDALAEAGMLAADGRCKTFDDRADGYVRGEGCGAVVLKPLALAERDGDHVYAVLLGSAVNQDGRTNGLTAPSFGAQVDVLRRAHRRAGVGAADLHYIESHGTGTALGDAMEARALHTVLADRHDESGADPSTTVVGSVKTVLGHLEAAAGIMGLIKTALALQHRRVPGNLNFETPSSHVDFEQLAFSVAAANAEWPAHEGPALAGVSSFGFGGTNAHVVLTGAPAAAEPAPAAETPSVFLVSGRSEHAALAQVGNWLNLLDGPQPPELAALSYASTRRSAHHPFRVGIVATQREELRERLSAVASGTLPWGAAAAKTPRGAAGPIGFVFSGQGNQWIGMGRSLIRRQPVFRDALMAVDRELRPLLGWSPFAVLERGRDAEALSDTGVAQPVLFAVQVAIAELWRSWGVVPAAVAGHSVGEIAAAHLAGVLDLATASGIIAARARATARVRGNGSMAVVNLPVAEAETALPPGVHIAGRNAPRWTLISGDTTAVETALARWEREAVLTRRLPGDYAFHSPAMRDSLPEFASGLTAFAPSGGDIPFYSTVTGGRVDGGLLDVDYWVDQVVRPVAFAEAVSAMIEAGVHDFVEIGPHPVLGGMVKSLLRHHERAGIAVPSLARDLDDLTVLLSSVAELHVHGHDIDWAAVDPAPRPPIRLPLYPFDRGSYRIIDGLPRIEAPEPSPPTGLFAEDADYVAPRTEYEQFVAEQWAELLGVERVGVFENFFRIGGHSLLATRFAHRVRELFDIEFPLRLVFTEPTVASVAAALERLLIEQANAVLEKDHELTS
ncbi:type I polyketide synthase [Nocardia sp. NPDC020380]|uniref:type I polyketide synthase n=1 Tax=Nocardia sp. NPDC020380 TaxID=3364309 RepID=UPI0037A4D029